MLPFTENQRGTPSTGAGKPHELGDAEQEMSEHGVGESEGEEEATVRMPKIPTKPSKQIVDEHRARADTSRTGPGAKYASRRARKKKPTGARREESATYPRSASTTPS